MYTVSFQRIIVPLLRLVTLPRFQNSTLSQFVNPVRCMVCVLDHSEQASCFCSTEACKKAHARTTPACSEIICISHVPPSSVSRAPHLLISNAY